MFEKLVALLPSNPGMINQLAFYSKRMREEAIIRRTGMVFIVFAFFIQFFAVLSPPVATSAASDNDLIVGGISSPADARQKCKDNVRNYKIIMNNYGIKCADLGSADVVQLHSDGKDGQYYSVGHNPQGAKNNNTGKKTNEKEVNIQGLAHPVYWRLLHSWDTGASSTYTALHLHNASGKNFYVLYNCGNLVSIGFPQGQPTPDKDDDKPVCQYDKSLPADSPKCFKPCTYNHAIPAGDSKCFKPCDYNSSIPASDSKCVKPCQYNNALPANSPDCHPPVTQNVCQYNASLPANSPQCFAPCQYNSALPASSPQCFQPCQYNSTIAASSSQCFQPCDYNSGIPASSPQCFQPCQYNSGIPSNSPQCFQPCQYNNQIPATDAQCFQPCQYYPTISAASSECKPCEQSQSSDDLAACISINKSASNDTQHIANANGTTANGADVITYTLYAKNNGKKDFKDYVFNDNFSDVLDYADIVDLHGGSLDADKYISWPKETIAAGATASHQVTVKVKNPIPQTPADPGDTSHFDMTMTNVYGDTVNIHLPQAPVQTVTTVATNLPNTGPGTSLVVIAGIMILGGYFYSRTKILQEESTIAVQEAANA